MRAGGATPAPAARRAQTRCQAAAQRAPRRLRLRAAAAAPARRGRPRRGCRAAPRRRWACRAPRPCAKAILLTCIAVQPPPRRPRLARGPPATGARGEAARSRPWRREGRSVVSALTQQGNHGHTARPMEPSWRRLGSGLVVSAHRTNATCRYRRTILECRACQRHQRCVSRACCDALSESPAP